MPFNNYAPRALSTFGHTQLEEFSKMSMTRRFVPALVTACLATAPLAAQAQDIGYTYVDVGYVTTDIDGVSEDLDGFVLRGSLEIAENWFLYARYVDQSISAGGVHVDGQEYAVGGGFAWPFADNMDLFGRIGYTEVELDVSGGFGGLGFDDDGYELGVGIRARPIEPLELEGVLNYVDLSDSGDDTSLGLAARWFVTDAFALGIEGDFDDDAETYGIGFRLQF
jgi:hypothetical protein